MSENFENEKAMSNKKTPKDELTALRDILISWRDFDTFFAEPSFALLRFTMDNGQNLFYSRDDIHFESDCRVKGETDFRTRYDAACALISFHEENCIVKHLEQAFCGHLENDITHAESYILRMRRKGYDSDILDKLDCLFDRFDLEKTIYDALCSELKNSRYNIQAFEYYSKRIKCSEFDSTCGETGLARLFSQFIGNIYYAYDCSEAWDILDGDVSDIVEAFAETAPKKAQKKLIADHIEPALCLLEELEELVAEAV